MVRWLYQKLASQYSDPDSLALGAWGWIIRNIRYPNMPDGRYFDRHEVRGFLGSVVQGGEMPIGEPLVYLVNSWDYWQFPAETLTYLYGDCEDAALVLVSLLRNVFSEKVVRVAVGDVRKGNEWMPHAWTQIVRSGVPYVMDSTLRAIPDPPWRRVSDLSNEYRPTLFFNDVIIEEVANA